jgi:hypothetical protein
MFFAGDAGFEDVEAHDVAGRVVKDKSEEVEINDGMEALSEIVEEHGQVAMLGDSLGDLKQGFELTPGVFQRRGGGHFRRGKNGIRHRAQNSTGVGKGSTKLPGTVVFRCVKQYPQFKGPASAWEE